MISRIIVLLASTLILFSNYSFGYDDQITHRDITTSAVNKSLLDPYLKNNLKLSNGIDETFQEKTVLTLLRTGSTEEDSPSCRAASHFLNPLKDWETAGVSDTNETILGAFVITPVCFATDPFSSRFSRHKYADVTWATGLTSPTAQISDTGNDMDWNAARKYYRLALTATDNATRETYFAQTFQALGQVMHLLQDMAVPAHVRNDFTAHLAFQKVNGLLPSKWYGNTYEWYVKNNENLVNSAMTSSTVVRPPNNLLTALWDANKYDGNNPSDGTVQGLAEYANANFFSESTIFAELKDPTDIHYFPRPNKADTNALEQEMLATTMEVTAEDGIQDRTIHVTKKTGGYKVAAYSFLGQRVARRIVADGIAPFSYVSEWQYNLGDEVYKDYIQKLIPRAVGYSAGLIDYFFRGEIDMKPDSGQYVIKNESDEAMSGTFRLYYDDTTGIRQLVPAADWYLSIAAKGASSPVTFTAPSDAKEPGKYMLVFLGTHGAESGAVVGKSIELKNDLDIRIVTVSNYVSEWEDRRGQIKVFTNKGIIYGKIPKEIFAYSIVKVKFDKSNPSRIAILTFDKYFTKKIYTFKVDEINKSINYEKTIYEENYIPYSHSYEIVNEDFDYSYIDPVKGSCNYVYRNVKIVFKNKGKNIVDFYLDNEYLKLFYSYSSSINEYLAQNQEDCCGGDDGCSVDDHDNYYYIAKIYMDETTDIYYGDNKVASMEHLCTGGWFSSDGYDYNECTNGSNADKYYYPMAIFNKNDYAYGINNGGLLVDVETSLPYDLSQYIVNGTIGLNHLVLKDDSYGFNITTGARGSFSSSLGSLACGGFLVTDIQAGGGYVTKTWGGFSVFRSCNDYTIINSPAYYIDSKDVFDVYVK